MVCIARVYITHIFLVPTTAVYDCVFYHSKSISMDPRLCGSVFSFCVHYLLSVDHSFFFSMKKSLFLLRGKLHCHIYGRDETFLEMNIGKSTSLPSCGGSEEMRDLRVVFLTGLHRVSKEYFLRDRFVHTNQNILHLEYDHDFLLGSCGIHKMRFFDFKTGYLCRWIFPRAFQ